MSCMQKFLIIPNCLKPETAGFAVGLAQLLHDRGQAVCMLPEHADFTGADWDELADPQAPQADAAVVLGGDGTVLTGLHRYHLLDMPFFGINFGRLGYLTECEPGDAPAYIDAILQGRSFMEDRIVLEGALQGKDGKQERFFAVNEAVIYRGGMNRALRFSISVNGNCIHSFAGDGILVATPTGSTAYNISAGGPVLMPASDCFVVTPVCSQFRSSCPLVVPAGDTISIAVEAQQRFAGMGEENLVLDVDSFTRYSLQPGDIVEFCRSSHRVRMIKTGTESFYAALKKKLSSYDK